MSTKALILSLATLFALASFVQAEDYQLQHEANTLIFEMAKATKITCPEHIEKDVEENLRYGTCAFYQQNSLEQVKLTVDAYAHLNNWFAMSHWSGDITSGETSREFSYIDSQGDRYVAMFYVDMYPSLESGVILVDYESYSAHNSTSSSK